MTDFSLGIIWGSLITATSSFVTSLVICWMTKKREGRK